MQEAFPGSLDFSYQNYWDLPYPFVIDAVWRIPSVLQRRHHWLERPTAVLTSMIANVNRDVKKNRKGYTASDFYLYEPAEQRDIPHGSFGAAALALIKQQKFPSWGLFCFKALQEAAASSPIPPKDLALMADGAMLLAPVATDEGFSGMLICTEAASDKILPFEDDDGNVYLLETPPQPTKFVAEEDVVLYRVNQ